MIEERVVGEARVATISAGVVWWTADFNVPRADWLPETPEAGPDGRLRLGTNWAFVRTGSARVLIDPCVWDPEALKNSSTIELASEPVGIDEALANLSVNPSDVTHVLMTHRHADHCSVAVVAGPGGYTPRFPNAVHVLNRLDWEDAQRQPQSEVRDLLQPIADAGQLLPVSGTHDVVDGIRFVHAPGETRGHSVVEVTSGSGTLYYAGDLFHLPVEFAHTDWIPAGRDLETTIGSRDWLIERAVATDAWVVFTHSEFPGWGKVERPTPHTARWVPQK